MEKFLLRLSEALNGFPNIKIFRAENKVNSLLKEIRRNMLKVEKRKIFLCKCRIFYFSRYGSYSNFKGNF